MIEERIRMTTTLNQLGEITPYTFTIASVLGRKMGVVKKKPSKMLRSEAAKVRV